MSQYKCPIPSCGRILQNQSVLKQHLERRHPNFNIQSLFTKNQQDRVMQEEINRLPKLKNLKLSQKQRDKQQKMLVDVYRKSSSKNKKQANTSGMMLNLNKSKISAVIGQSKKIIENNETNHNIKRPSLNKKNSITMLNQSQTSQKLPELKQTNKVKLQKLTQSHIKLVNKGQAQQKNNNSYLSGSNVMNTTAPNFKNLIRKEISSRQRSNSKRKSSNLIQESKKEQDNSDLMFIKTQEGFSKLHKPLLQKRQYLKPKEEQSKEIRQNKEDSIRQEEIKIKKQKSLKQEQLSQNKVQAQEQKPDLKSKQSSSKLILKRQDKLSLKPSANAKPRRQVHQRNNSSNKTDNQNSASLDEYNFQQRIIVFKPNIGPKLTLPPTTYLEFLFANNCNISTLNISNCQNLREISLQHNNIKELSFLNYQYNSSIEKMYLQHNQLTLLEYLPPSLIVLSVSFNQIQNLQVNTRQLSKITSLRQLDFSFNPIRKENNYKHHVIANCYQLTKIDGMKITKFDLELASQYSKIIDESLGLIPSNKLNNLIVSKCSNTNSTVISFDETDAPLSLQEQQEEVQDKRMSQQLQMQILSLEKIIKSTKNNMNIIYEENQIIKSEIEELREKMDQQEEEFSVGLYEKLRGECSALELLNFLQYASQEELGQLILKKRRQLEVN